MQLGIAGHFKIPVYCINIQYTGITLRGLSNPFHALGFVSATKPTARIESIAANPKLATRLKSPMRPVKTAPRAPTCPGRQKQSPWKWLHACLNNPLPSQARSSMATSIAIAPVSRPIELSGGRKRTEESTAARTDETAKILIHADRISGPPGLANRPRQHGKGKRDTRLGELKPRRAGNKRHHRHQGNQAML